MESTTQVGESGSSKKINGLKGLLTEVMKIVAAKNPDEVIAKLNEMRKLADRKI